jgi:hypothetical protein
MAVVSIGNSSFKFVSEVIIKEEMSDKLDNKWMLAYQKELCYD